MILKSGILKIKITAIGGNFVLEAGFEPARPVRHYPLKIACLPNSTTPADIY
jgi:hypothetical protein